MAGPAGRPQRGEKDLLMDPRRGIKGECQDKRKEIKGLFVWGGGVAKCTWPVRLNLGSGETWHQSKRSLCH